MLNVNKLKGLMAEGGFSQKQMAQILNIHEQTYGNYLKSKSMPTDKLEKIATIFDIEDFNIFFTD